MSLVLLSLINYDMRFLISIKEVDNKLFLVIIFIESFGIKKKIVIFRYFKIVKEKLLWLRLCYSSHMKYPHLNAIIITSSAFQLFILCSIKATHLIAFL